MENWSGNCVIRRKKEWMMVRRGDGINGKGKRKRNEINKKERRKDFIKEEIS